MCHVSLTRHSVLRYVRDKREKLQSKEYVELFTRMINLRFLSFHRANETVWKELEETQMRLSVASQELNSVKASAQQAQREREQVKDYRNR